MSATSAREPLELTLLTLLETASQSDGAWQLAQMAGYIDQLKALRAVAQQHKLRGLSNVVALLDRGMAQLLSQGHMLSEDDGALLSTWPALVLTELLPPDPSALPCAWDTLHSLQHLAWFAPIAPEAASYIESRLSEDAASMAVAAPDPAPYAAQAHPVTGPEPDAAVQVTTEAFAALEETAVSQLEFADALPETSAIDTPLLASVAHEEMAMVAEALAALQEEALPNLLAAQSDAETAQAATHYEEHVANLLNAATHLGLSGLEKILQTVLVNVALLQASPELATPSLRQCIAEWVPLAIAYTQAPHQIDSTQLLALSMTDPSWLHATDFEMAQAWGMELSAVALVNARANDERRTIATAEDVDLSIPSDIESNVLDSLLFELPLHAQNFTLAIQRLHEGGTLEDMEDARRIAHTLKGAGNTAGIKGIGNLTHVVEDVLLAFGRVQRLPTPAVQDSLVEAADCLETMSESLAGGTAVPAEALAVYQQMLDWVVKIDTDGLPADETQDDDLRGTGREFVSADLHQAIGAQTGPTATAAPGADAPQEGEAVLRVPVSLIESLLKLVDEDAIIAAQMQERISRLNSEVMAQRASSRQFRQLSSELEQLVDVRGMAMMGGGSHGLDSLEMDQYNELHVLTRRIVEAGADSREFVQTIDGDINGLRDLVADKDRILAQIQTGIQRTRMVPVTSIVPRLQRAVRQAARVLDRSVQLHIEGETTLVDTQLLNAILDALMHLLRNAVDHGIEPAYLREAAGKPGMGTIVLRFTSVGSNVAISCKDDGQGFDLDGILRKAIQVGLVGQDAVLSTDQIMRLILRPGFSTREEATHISGRGIGMSIVHKAVQDLRGTLDLQSSPGAGCQFNMAFPVQLSAKQVMLTLSKHHRLAVSEHGLEQLLPVDPARMDLTSGAPVYVLDEARLPIVRLDDLLGLPTYALRDAAENEVAMVVVNDQRERTVVIGPELRESRRVILKPLSSFIPTMLGVDGVSILGDGTITTVIDLPDLLRGFERDDTMPVGLNSTTPVQALPLCLIVDDSVSVRRTMEQLMQDAGYEVIAARDGLDALTMLEHRTPQVALVDLEMPRMNGLELTKAMRNRTQTRSTPVVMITSRFTDRHRALAQEAGVNAFLTKPYTEETLLNLVDELLTKAATKPVVALV
jgi:chemotaxis protein histidine kinase CheA/ActR/RegA family two-component response regulator